MPARGGGGLGGVSVEWGGLGAGGRGCGVGGAGGRWYPSCAPLITSIISTFPRKLRFLSLHLEGESKWEKMFINSSDCQSENGSILKAIWELLFL